MRLTAILFLAGALTCRAADIPAARWEGTVQIPGRDLKVVVDLAPDKAGAWVGSITIPGLNVKGAPLTDIALKGGAVSFAIKDALSGPRIAPATIKAKLNAKGALAGDFQQGGNSAPIALEKTGPAQVDSPKRSTAVSAEVTGEWKGKYELGGYSRDVTLKLGDQAGTASVEFIIVGKKVNNIPVTHVAQDGDYLVIEAPTFGMTYEGRFRRDAGEIQGTLIQGPFEVPLNLRRNP